MELAKLSPVLLLNYDPVLRGPFDPNPVPSIESVADAAIASFSNRCNVKSSTTVFLTSRFFFISKLLRILPMFFLNASASSISPNSSSCGRYEFWRLKARLFLKSTFSVINFRVFRLCSFLILASSS